MRPQDILVVMRRPVAFYAIFAEIGGGATAGLFLSQAIYWSREMQEEAEKERRDWDGWFFKSMAEWHKETFLTRTEQETARRRLRSAGIIEEKHAGVPAKLYFRLDLVRLSELLSHAVDENGNLDAGFLQPGKAKTRNLKAGNLPARMQKTSNLGRAKTASRGAENPQSYIGTETTSETTQTLVYIPQVDDVLLGFRDLGGHIEATFDAKAKPLRKQVDADRRAILAELGRRAKTDVKIKTQDGFFSAADDLIRDLRRGKRIS